MNLQKDALLEEIRCLLSPGSPAASTSTERCTVLNEHVSNRWNIPLEAVADITWSLIVKAVHDAVYSAKPDQEMLAASFLLDLHQSLPTSLDDIVPGTTLTLNQALTASRVSLTKPLCQPSSVFRQVLAGAAMPRFPTRTNWAAGRNGTKAVAHELLQRVLQLLHDDELRTDLWQQWCLENGFRDGDEIYEDCRSHSVIAEPEASDTPQRVDAPPSELRQRLADLSAVLATELDRAATVDMQTVRFSQGFYVDREAQGKILEKLTSDAMHARLVISAEAGFGKSSLLWYLYTAMSKSPEKIECLLLSAHWFLNDSSGISVLSWDDLHTVIEEISKDTADICVLIDTADLLLHSNDVQIGLAMALEKMSRQGVSWCISSRPREVDALNLDGLDIIHLGAYTSGELSHAAQSLRGALCPRIGSETISAWVDEVIANSQPILEVAKSPLMLRLLFELYAPNEPTLHLDADTLYASFWKRRIQSDTRGGPSDGNATLADLSAAAAAAGVVMLAEGTIECSLRLIHETGQSLYKRILSRLHPATNTSFDHDLDQLIRRGVLRLSHGSVRFVHQTLLEYAAAQGLRSLDPVEAITRLRDRVLQYEHDLFTGAVLARLLIVSGANRLLTHTVADCCATLLSSPQLQHREIALTVLSRHPVIALESTENLTNLERSSLKGFVDKIASVLHDEPQRPLRVLELLWAVNDVPVRLSVVDACSRFAFRAPSAVAKVARACDFLTFVVDHRPTSPTCRFSLPRLYQWISEQDSVFAADCMTTLLMFMLNHSTGKQNAVALLKSFAEIWNFVGDSERLAAIVSAVVHSQEHSDKSSKSVREALATVLQAEWQRKPGFFVLRESLRTATAGLNEDAESVLAEAQLIAITLYLQRNEATTPVIEDYAQTLFSMNKRAVFQLKRSVLPIALSRKSTFGDTLAAVMNVQLRMLLQASPEDAARRPGIVVRQALTDPRVLDDYFIAIVDGPDWHGHHWYSAMHIAILAGRASVLGIRSAQDAMKAPTPELSSHDEQVFTDGLLAACAGRIEIAVCEHAIVFATRRRRVGSLNALVQTPEYRAILRQVSPMIVEVFEGLLSMDAKQALEAAAACRGLMSHDALIVDAVRLFSWLSLPRHPKATANVLQCLAMIDDPNALVTLAAICHRHLAVSGYQYAAAPASGQPALISTNPVFTETCREVMLSISHRLVGSRQISWNLVKELATKTHPGRETSVTTAGMVAVSRYICQTLRVHGYNPASRCLLEILRQVSTSDFSAKQRRVAMNDLRPAVLKVAAATPSTALSDLVDALTEIPTDIAQLYAKWLFEAMTATDRATYTHRLNSNLPETVRRVVLNVSIRRSPDLSPGTFQEVLSLGHV